MDHNTEIRSIISHALLGSDENITRETFDLCVDEVVKYINKLSESHFSKVIGVVCKAIEEYKLKLKQSVCQKNKHQSRNNLDTVSYYQGCVDSDREIIDQLEHIKQTMTA